MRVLQILKYGYSGHKDVYNSNMENYYQYNLAAHKLDNKHSSAINNLSNYYRITGDYEKAIEYGKMGINIDQNKEVLYITLAETYLHLKNMDKFYEKAEIALKKGYSIERLCNNEVIKGILDDVYLQEIMGKYKKQEYRC